MSRELSSQRIIIPPMAVSNYIDTELEPQMIQQMNQNSAILYLDSQDSALELNKANMFLSSIKTYTDNPKQLCHGVGRLNILSSGIYWVTPNVNITNNTITFISSNTGATVYTVTVPEGFYATSASLIAAVVTAMNTVTGSSGLTFSTTNYPLSPDKYTLSSAGGTYQILSTCSAVLKGDQLYALPKMTALAASGIVGTMFLYGTKYIDICSSRLNQYTKIRSETTAINSNIIFRVFVDDPTRPHIIAFFNQVQMPCTNFNNNDVLTVMDFQLRDQFGEILYIPPGGGTTGQGGFNWDMQLLVEF